MFKFNGETPIKITQAAEAVGVSYKTIYNWIGDGVLAMFHPGYVMLSEVRRAQIVVANRRSSEVKARVLKTNRDRNGRFTNN